MKILRYFTIFMILVNFAGLVNAVRVGGWYWMLAIVHLLNGLAFVEILHSMYKKPTMPHPTSLAFQKEVIERYRG